MSSRRMVFFILERRTFLGPAFSLRRVCVAPRPPAPTIAFAPAPDPTAPWLSLTCRCPMLSFFRPPPPPSPSPDEAAPGLPDLLPPLAGLSAILNRSESITLACGLGFW